jgi:hypothetical protein
MCARLTLLALFGGALLPCLGWADDATPTQLEYEHLHKTYAPMLVTIKYVQQLQNRFGDFGGENEITGVMVDPTGLVLCSNLMLLGGRPRTGGQSVPTDIPGHGSGGGR